MRDPGRGLTAVATTQYRLLSPDGTAVAGGGADVQVAGGALVLSPQDGDVLRIAFQHIVSVTENQPFVVSVGLADGSVLELSRLGRMRTQLLAELSDGRADGRAAGMRPVGAPASFSGLSGAEPVELRVYDDALLVIGASRAQRISFSFVSTVRAVDYVVTVEKAGRPAVQVSRLGRRTGEFTDLLTDRLSAARARTAAFVGALVPWLDPLALGRAASLLRDGAGVPAVILDEIHPGLTDSLLDVAALPARRQAVAQLGRRGELAVGFKQVASVHRAAVGVTPWRDPAVTPHIGEHDSPGGSFGGGLTGMLTAGAVAGGIGPGGMGLGGIGPGGIGAGGMRLGGGASAGGLPSGFAGGYGVGGSFWALQALGLGTNADGQHQMASRREPQPGRLTPAGDDLPALTVAGPEPTVLAFALCRTAGRVALEVLNHGDLPTFVYRAAGPDALAQVNQALDDEGFQVTGPEGGLGSAPQTGLSQLLAGRASHGADWTGQLDALLAG
jgi:hypothetical protein